MRSVLQQKSTQFHTETKKEELVEENKINLGIKIKGKCWNEGENTLDTIEVGKNKRKRQG